MTKTLSPRRLALTGLGLLVLTVILLWRIQSSDFLLLPDTAHPAAPIVRVQGGHDPRGPGGIFYVDVLEQRASLLDKLVPGLHDGASLVPASRILPPGTNDQAARRINLALMRTSQQVAAAVALRSLGYKVTAKARGVAVGSTLAGSDGARKLRPGDVILSVDGHPVRTVEQLVDTVGEHRIGEQVDVGLDRFDTRLHVKVQLTRLTDPTRPGLGIGDPENLQTLQTPLDVTIDAGSVGGPSAGLPFALEVVAELGKNVTHGRRVVATGELHADGTVSAIGGVKQKTFGARMADADVFLVPAGDNYREALHYAHGLRIVPVSNFQQALHVLATLPGKRA